MLSLTQNEQILKQDIPLWIIFWAWEDRMVTSKNKKHLLHNNKLIIPSKNIYPPKTQNNRQNK